MIIARIESLIAGNSVEDALERAREYVKAGADGIMIHSKNKSGEDIKDFCIRFRKEHPLIPIVVVPTTYNQIYESELHEWGGECGDLCKPHAQGCLSGHEEDCRDNSQERTLV